MANGGIIGPTNPVGKIVAPKTSLFTSSGTLTTAACSSTADVLIVAGGGSGGGSTASQSAGGGGGAGGVRQLTCQPISASTDYTVTVGAGAAGCVPGSSCGAKGSNSTFGASPEPLNLSATGGGLGGKAPDGSPGGPGGSGGGGTNTGSAGAGNEGCYTPVEGYAGEVMARVVADTQV